MNVQDFEIDFKKYYVAFENSVFLFPFPPFTIHVCREGLIATTYSPNNALNCLFYLYSCHFSSFRPPHLGRMNEGQQVGDADDAAALGSVFVSGRKIGEPNSITDRDGVNAHAEKRMARAHVHPHETVISFLTVPQRASARRASKVLWEAVTAASMEDMLRATVLWHPETGIVDRATLVVVAMSRAPGPFPSVDALVAWCGGLAHLYDELPKRFPHAAAIGVSAQLGAIRPFPFASGATMTVCVVTTVAAAPSALVVESISLGVQNATNILVHTLSYNGAPSPILCLEEAVARHFPQAGTTSRHRPQHLSKVVHDVLLSSLPPIRSIDQLASRVGDHAFANCVHLSISLANLPLLKSIGQRAFAEFVNLFSVDLSSLAAAP